MTSSDATYWRERYRACDTPWDKGCAHPALVLWLEQNKTLPGGRVLVPGCGIGHDVRSWASAGLHSVGLDIAPEAVEMAGSFSHSQTAGAVEFCAGSIFEPPADFLGSFDWIFEHTCFCAIHPGDRPAYAAAIPALLRPGGKFLAIFYMRPDHDDSPPYGSEEEELLSLFGRDFERLSKAIAEPTFAGREGREEIWLWQKKF